jgi:hypothetical protein
MASIEIPDNARYVLISSVPNGEQTTAEVRWDDTQDVDAGTALVIIEMGKAVLMQQIEQERLQRAKAKLMAPLAVAAIMSAPGKNGKGAS